MPVKQELFANRKASVVGKIPETVPAIRRLTRVEVLGDPEREDASITVVTIAGNSYTGKTGLAEKLGKRMKFKKNKIFLVGNFMREAKRAGREAQGTLPQDKELDEKSDAKQSEIALDATTQEPALLESRLAALRVKEIRKEHPEQRINSVSILLLASDDIRKERAMKRTTDEIKKRIRQITTEVHELEQAEQTDINSILLKGARVRLDYQRQRLDNLDINELWEEELGRQRDDQAEYREIYPWLSNYQQDYMDPELTDEYGNHVYDIVFDTSPYKPEEVYDRICEEIRRFRQSREDINVMIKALEDPQTVYEEDKPDRAFQTQPC